MMPPMPDTATPATPSTPAAPTPRFVQTYQFDAQAVRSEILDGLLAPHAQLSPKFLYDSLGSRLFEAITELPEYYPTRTEAAIFATHGPDMARVVPAGAVLVDLGAGNCQKAARLFGLLHPARYVAVDISVEFLRDALHCLQRQHPGMDMLGLGMDFSQELTLPAQAAPAPGQAAVLFYPGSSIGNFTPQQALAFLRRVHAACASGGLLIGVDLVKGRAELEAAYDDALGVTAAFNLNMLLHLNRLADTDFRVRDWQHVALYDEQLSRIEMHLQARHALTVSTPRGPRAFAAGERIHTENSCKWTVGGFDALLRQAGFGPTRCWLDDASRFAVFWAPGGGAQAEQLRKPE